MKARARALLFVVIELLLGIAGVAVLGAGVLAWRLSEGPIDVTGIARRLLAAEMPAGVQLTLDHAALVWEGFQGGAEQPLGVRLVGLAASGRNGVPLAQIDAADLSLSVAPLLVGRAVPERLVLSGASLQLVRTADGGLQLGAAPTAPAAPESPAGGTLAARLQALLRGSGGRRSGPLDHLRRLRLERARIVVADQQLGASWQAAPLDADLTRMQDGRVRGSAAATLGLGGVSAQLSLQADLAPAGPAATHLTARLSAVNPAQLAAAAPRLAPLAALDAPVTLAVEASLDRRLQPLRLRLAATIGAGTAHIAQGTVPLAAASAVVEGTPAALRLTAGRLALAPLPGAAGPPPVIAVSGVLDRREDGFGGSATVDLDRVAFADLAHYWPAGISGDARHWITANITSGWARDGHVVARLQSAPDFSNLTLTGLEGGITGDDLTLWWLRPVPPLQHVAARLAFLGPDVAMVTVTAGAESALTLTDGSVRMSGLLQKQQIGRIDVDLSGPLPEALHLLANPRLQLLSRRPLPFTDPAGTMAGHLMVQLPLDARVGLDAVKIKTAVRLSDVHLGAVALGRSIDQGDFQLTADGDGLQLHGQARFAGIPAALQLAMDFTAGPPQQVLEHAELAARTDPSELRAAGLATAGTLSGGSVLLGAVYDDRRDGEGTVRLNADLTAASLTTPLGWSKAPGAPATATARLTLRHDQLAAIDELAADGPGLAIRSHADVQNGRTQMLHLDQVQIGRTAATGSLQFPSRPDQPISAALSGASLDLSAFFGNSPAPAGGKAPPVQHGTGAPASRGQPWRLDARFARVILAGGNVLAPFLAQAQDDGRHVTAADIAAGAAEQIRLTLTPQPNGRRLAGTAADAGALLRDLGVLPNLRSGRLILDARYDDSLPTSPLVGTATINDFRIMDAPAVTRLLQAMTLYGLVDLARGPGLRFSRLVAPFRWENRVLTLSQARAYSSSLGFTAQGTINVGLREADLRGTIVPAYFFNQLLGHLPLIGKLFSPERGGGVFAASYSVQGPLADPRVHVNPLAALTPGFLRGLFGIFR